MISEQVDTAITNHQHTMHIHNQSGIIQARAHVHNGVLVPCAEGGLNRGRGGADSDTLVGGVWTITVYRDEAENMQSMPRANQWKCSRCHVATRTV